MLGRIKYYKCDTGLAPGRAPLGGDRRRGTPGRPGERRDGRALAIAALALVTAAGLLAAQPRGWTGAPSGDGGAAVPDAWLLLGDAAFAGLLPGYAFAQSVTQTLSLTAADSITDAGALELDGAQGITTFESGGSAYAAVASNADGGVQILDVADPSAVTAADSITDTLALLLDGAWGIATFESGDSTYAAVASNADGGVQILDITDPSAVTAADSITDGGALLLDGASGIAVFESGSRTYAAVAAFDDDGLQIIDVTDPSAITVAGSIGDAETLELDGASGIAVFESGTHTYAAVAAYNDDGVQILRLTGDGPELAGSDTVIQQPDITDPPNSPPTVTSIVRSDPADQATTNRTLVFAVTFSENVTGVDAGDFALSAGSTGADGASEQLAQTSEPAIPVPDRSAIQDAIAVGQSGTATSVSVSVDITHTYIGDLKIDLVAPDGTAKTLHDRTGGSADDIDQTYEPDFAGESIAGDWTLRVRDGAGGDTGTLNGWTLTINYGAGTANPVTSLSGSGSTYQVTVSATQDGTYNLDLIPSGHGIADESGNPLTDTAPTGADHTYTVSTVPAVSTAVADTTAPRLFSIERSSPSGATTSSQTLVYQVTFSEAVTGLDAADFALSLGSTGDTDGGTGTGQFTHTSSPALVNLGGRGEVRA